MVVHNMSRAIHQPLVVVVDGVPTFAPGTLDLLASWPLPSVALTFYLRALEELYRAVGATGSSPELHEKMKEQASRAWNTKREWVTPV